MRDAVGDAVCGELAGDGLVGAARAVAGRVAALDHEAGHNTVEREAVVEALLGKVAEVGDRDRGGVGVERHLDGPIVLDLDARVVDAGGVGIVGVHGLLS